MYFESEQKNSKLSLYQSLRIYREYFFVNWKPFYLPKEKECSKKGGKYEKIPRIVIDMKNGLHDKCILPI